MMYGKHSLVPSPSHPSFCLAAVEKKRFFSTGVGRTGNEAMGNTLWLFDSILLIASSGCYLSNLVYFPYIIRAWSLTITWKLMSLLNSVQVFQGGVQQDSFSQRPPILDGHLDVREPHHHVHHLLRQPDSGARRPSGVRPLPERELWAGRDFNCKARAHLTLVSLL